MRVAALYDVHGMPWALEAVLAEVDADAIVIGGDVFGGPYDEETFAVVQSLDATYIRGNAENDDPRTRDWLSKGAQPTDAVRKLLKTQNIG